MNRNDFIPAISFFLVSSTLLLSISTDEVVSSGLLSQISGFLVALAITLILPKNFEREKSSFKINVSTIVPVATVFVLSVFTGVEASFKVGLLFSGVDVEVLVFVGVSTFLSQFFGIFFYSLLEWLLCIFFDEEFNVSYNDLIKINSIIYMIYIVPVLIDLWTLPSQLSIAKNLEDYRGLLLNLFKIGKVVENLVISLYYIGLRLITRLSPDKALISSTLPNLTIGLIITLFSR